MKTRKIPYTIHYSLFTIHRPFLGFTLVEILIVVAILGILASVIIPEYRNYTQKAKESAAKENLQMLRSAIERYAIQHNGVAPGYDSNTGFPVPSLVESQLKGYLQKFPENPLNDTSSILLVSAGGSFASEPYLTNIFGWVYKPQTKEIRLNWTGTDSQGVRYYDY